MAVSEEQLKIFKGGDRSQDFYGSWNNQPVVEAEKPVDGQEIVEQIGGIILSQEIELN